MDQTYSIPFNKPYMSGKELHYISQAVLSGMIKGNGNFTNKVHELFKKKFGFENCLLTTSCTDALEMAAMLIGIKEGDEVIMPSFTFVSTANAFVLRGAKILFADSLADHPNMDVSKLEALITPKTRAIVPVHYAGVACDMDKIMELANKYNLYVIEDAAQAIDAYYKERPLGSFGHMATFSFHETKNIIAGEGGMLVINDQQFFERAEILWEKGTNRAAFFRGEVNKYGWVDAGSSFLPSDIIAAFLYAQLENLEDIQRRRGEIWHYYKEKLQVLEDEGFIKLPVNQNWTTNNFHMFYIVCRSLDDRTALINHLKAHNVLAVFHYLSLHKSEFYQNKHDGRDLTNSDFFTDHLLRLPFFYEITEEELEYIVSLLFSFFKGTN
ncbi:dTDP-4-amino-4,6-dideoxygalactose transaminase [Carboxylicivirga mesophila]|uniref:dTDP-4-amino-4,6-dideoxygalactose transaminase n=1 Tax=Carboxylicivirga mesophila TaxID=1166478 RepID=A0ABS5K965_9BACT|nr:dTDP-4-amino-4,6-dideoxygalactose transaminase [Carboxylicivirga mesophila]MBS2211495.1 dTDP-4-amino-4,6-dideoxygalactose transaminase [Carboxylicivirga mesophila]